MESRWEEWYWIRGVEFRVGISGRFYAKTKEGKICHEERILATLEVCLDKRSKEGIISWSVRRINAHFGPCKSGFGCLRFAPLNLYRGCTVLGKLIPRLDMEETVGGTRRKKVFSYLHSKQPQLSNLVWKHAFEWVSYDDLCLIDWLVRKFEFILKVNKYTSRCLLDGRCWILEGCIVG